MARANRPAEQTRCTFATAYSSSSHVDKNPPHGVDAIEMLEILQKVSYLACNQPAGLSDFEQGGSGSLLYAPSQNGEFHEACLRAHAQVLALLWAGNHLDVLHHLPAIFARGRRLLLAYRHLQPAYCACGRRRRISCGAAGCERHGDIDCARARLAYCLRSRSRSAASSGYRPSHCP